jgi:enoyl-CoA hydratase/carnithine racemase
MSETFETLVCSEPAEHVLQVTLSRPAASNALNTRMGEELGRIFARLAEAPPEVRCVVITGEGAKAFCAGGDLKEREGMSDEAWLAQHRIFERTYWSIMECPLPVLCAVNGHAFGGGLEMVLASDFAYAVPAAKFALTEVRLGIIPGAGGTQNLPRAIGSRRATEVILTGRPFTAEQALDWGVINRICQPDALLAEVLDTAAAIAANAPLAVRQAKKAIHHGVQMDLTRGLWLEVEAYNRLVFTADRHEGVRAFNEKRPPKFEGR